VSGVSPRGVGRDPLTALRDGRVQGEAARLRAATRLLEGTFYQELFKAMRQTVPDGGGPDGGAGEEIFTGMLDQHIADAAALRSERGLGEALYRHFARAAGIPEGGASGEPPPGTGPEG